MANSFSKIPVAVNERSRQNLSHPVVSTSDFGRMDVVYCNTDIVPGDDVNLKIDGFLRGAPMPAPTYGKVDIDIRVFFVPHRILCSKPNDGEFSWDNYITGVSSTSQPYFLLTNLANRVRQGTEASPNEAYIGSNYEKDLRRLYSQLRIPKQIVNSTGSRPPRTADGINVWRFGAYQRVWWDWYRDSALINESSIRSYLPVFGAGEQTGDTLKAYLWPRYACWKKDYFTTAKLNPQSGAATVGAPSLPQTYAATNVASGSLVLPSLYDDSTPNISRPTNLNALPVQWLRAANALQKYLERNNLAGSRLMERFLARFGNTPSSIALDMSEYLGGASRSLQIGDITSNNEQDGLPEVDFTNAFATPTSSRGTIQGQLGGKSASDLSSGNINFHAKEFGTIIAIQVIRPHIMYTNGLSRELTRGVFGDRFDYFTPEMENLGYQPVYRKELCYLIDRNYIVDNAIFGYQSRYADYKVAQGITAGDFVLDGTSEGMDSWYFSRDFSLSPEQEEQGEAPTLSPAFTTISPYPRLLLDRIFSIPGTLGQFDHFNCFYNCEVHMSRPMSASSLPSLDEDLGQHGNIVNVPNGGVRM